MRSLAIGLLVISLCFGGPAMATDNGNGNPKPEEPKNSPTTPAPRETQPANTAGKVAEIESQIQQLRELLQSQAQQLEAQRAALQQQKAEIENLKNVLKAGKDPAVTTGTITSPVLSVAGPVDAGLESGVKSIASAQEEQGQKIAKIETEVNNTKKSVDAIKKANPFTFSGDVRFRVEPFYGGPVSITAGQTVRALEQVRTRVRARFNINAKLNDDLSGGVSFASGDVNDPIATNQTLSSYYSRKPLLFDRFFINYNPHWFKPLTLTVGKFAYPWYRTELTWDNDLNPEGAAQTLSFKIKTPVLKKITVVAFELPFNNVAGNATNGGSGANARLINSSFVYGGQVQTNWEFTSAVKVGAYLGYYDYHRADGIAVGLDAANTSQQFANIFRLGGASIQNVIASVPTGTVVTTLNAAGTPTFSTTFTPGGPFQFASKFGLLDAILRGDIKTGFNRYPVTLIADFVQNTRACSNQLPANAVLTNGLPGYSVSVAAGGTLTPPASATCRPQDRRGYWLEVRTGRTQEKGDWNFGYTYIRIEREAVVTAFNFSDLRQNSNLLNHRLEVFYQAHKNVQLAFTGLFGRPLATTEPLLKRLQFDLVYKF